MKRRLLCLLLTGFVLLTCALAADSGETAELLAGSVVASGECGADGDNVTWSLDSGGLLSITGSGAMANYYWYNSNLPWKDSVSDIVTVQIGSGVTSVGNYAFYECEALTGVTIPNSVTSIGDDAFYNCRGLTSVTIPNSVTSIGGGAFYGCRGLTNVAIPSSVTSIESGAFQYCSSLTSVTIPNSVTSIGYYAFYGCSALTSVTIPNSVTSIGYCAFYGCSALTSVTIPSSVTSIGYNAFSDCSALTSVTIPNSVTSIGSGMFSYCSALTSVTIPNSFTSIGDSAFYYCRGLTSVTIPDSVTSIGNSAFSGCSGLTSVTIPDSVTSIGNSAFSGCSGLTGVTIPDGVTSIGYSAFYGCDALTSVTIPDGVTSIGSSTFYDCNALTSVTIPDSVTSIGENAFYSCNVLTGVTISDSVTSIGNSAFFDCDALTDITISKNVTSIGESPFARSSSLASITVDAENPNYSSLDGVLFDKSQETLIQYPAGKVLESYTMPDSVTSIGVYACSDATFTGVTFPSGLTSIGDNAFYYCAALESVTLPDGLLSIGNSAFSHCTAMTSVSLPDSVTSMGQSAFYYCSGLSSVKIPSGMTSIAQYTFSSCSNLTIVVIPKSVISIGYEAFRTYYYSTSIRDIYYSGTEQEWAAITIGYNNYLGNAEIHYGADGPGEVISNGYCGVGDDLENISWTLYRGGKLQITGTGPVAASSSDNTLWQTYSKYIQSVEVGDGVASIPGSAFSSCSSMTEIQLPDSLTSIGSYAFSSCSRLKEVTIPQGVTTIDSSTFSSCDALTSVTIPDSVTSIGSYAFNSCTALTSVVIPDSVTSIGSYAFSSCTHLEDLTISNSVTSIGSETFSSCKALKSVAIPDSVTSIASKAFASCESLASVTIGSGLKTLAENAFSTCTGLTEFAVDESNENYTAVDGVLFSKNLEKLVRYTPGKEDESYDIPAGTTSVAGYAFASSRQLKNITIPNGVTSIDFNAFAACKALTEIVIPSGVTSISNETFYNCSSLTAVTIPEGVTSIGSNAFRNCSALTEITIPNTVTTIGGSAFRSCAALTQVAIPNSVTSIGGSAFYACGALAQVTLPDSVTSIGASAFQGCSALTEIVIPSGVTSLYSEIFQNCSNLASVTIPDSVTSIGSYAFSSCSALTEITIPNSVTSIGSYAFSSCDALTAITIPDSVTRVDNYAFQFCRSLSSITLPDSVTTLGYEVFRYCTSLDNATFGSGLTTIPYETFYECDKLASVTMSGNVTSVESYAFYNCSSLTDVYFGGTQTAWNALEIEDDSGNGSLLLATVHCSDGNIAGTRRLVIWLNADGSELDRAVYQSNETEPTTTKTPVKASDEQYNYIFTGWSSGSTDGGVTTYSPTFRTSALLPTFTDSPNYDLPAGNVGDTITEIDVSGAVSGGIEPYTFSATNLPQGITISESGVISGTFTTEAEATAATLTVTDGNGQTASIAIVVGAVQPAAMTASSGECGESLTWALDSDGALTISGAGDMYNYTDEAPAPWADSRAGIKTVQIGDGATSVGNAAFSGCTALTAVTLPGGLTTIGASAFRGCTELTAVTLPDTLTTVGEEAFYGCTKLTAVTIPNSVTSLGNSAFGGCAAMTSATIGGGLAEIGRSVFSGTGLTAVTIPSGVTSLGKYAFFNCTALTSVTIPVSVATVTESAFEGCTALKDVYYGGTEEQWNAVTIGESNELLTNATRHYSGTGTNPPGTSDTEAPVANLSPTATTVSVGSEVAFDASASTDNVGVVGYAWDFGDGSTASGEDATASHAFAAEGTYTVALTVRDAAGNSHRATATVTVTPAPEEQDTEAPVAQLSPTTITVVVGSEVTFDASASTDNVGIVDYAWDFGDGSTASGEDATASHAFAEEGTYTVTLTVKDAAGNEHSATATVTVTPAPEEQDTEAPVAQLSPTTITVVVGSEVTFDASASTDNVGIVDYAWDFGDDSTASGEDATASHAFAEEGTYTVTLTVKDAAGNSHSATATVTVTPAPEEQDTEAPVAQLSPAAITVPVGTAVVFDASASTDNVGIVNYAWDFGDDSTASGEDATASHDFAEEGTYTVTLTVRDAAGNSHSATAAVTVVADGDAVKLTALDTVSGKPVAGATISVTDGAGNTAQYAAGADGKVFLSAENGTYTVAASADGYQNRTFSVTVADDKRAFDVYLNAADVLRVETKVKELTKEEAVAAGIDTDAPENQHVYRSTAVFEFGELTYIHNDSEVLDYTPLSTGKITAYPVARDIYLIVYSQVNWLKELFRVQLYVQNTSNFEHIEDCAANLTLPEGLSLAVMTEDKDPQSLEVSLGTIDPGSEIGHNWYLCGDAAGEYTLSGSVSGVRANADNTVREDTSAEFTTSEPISVLAGSAMTLTITAEKYGVIGLPYHVAYELENVSEKTLYDVTLDVMGGQFVEDYDATDLEYDPDGKASGSLQSGFSVYDETFGPGEKLSGVFTIKFGKGLDIPRGMEYVLKDMFLWTDPESTTQIPTTFTLTNNERILLTYDANGGSGEMEAQLATKSLEASSFVYTLPECTLAAPENQHFKDWLVGETEYAPGDECTLTEDATILAVWEDDEEEYEEGVERTVTFNAAGGTVETAEKTVIAGQAYGELPVPARDHYTFAGWYTSADGGTVVTADDTALLSRDVTLYAHWTPLPYTITWVDEDGTTLATAEVPYGETPEYSGETPVKAQDELFMYEFAGWTPEVGPVSGETTYTARYDEISKLCTVTWFNYDGTPLETDENVAFGRTPEYNGETPERPPTGANSYEFIGWTPEVAPVNGDTAYMATYRTVPRTHTVTWLDEDGTVLATDEVAYGETPVYSGATPVKATDERYEYEFSGWKTTPRPIREDMTYEAAYTQTLRRYTITWLDEDGTELGTTEVPYGQIPAYDGETPRKEPTDEETYILAGWTPTLAPVSGEATYTARYRPSISASIEEVSIGEDGTITVRLECSEPGASILCGIYDENDQLIALQSLPVSEEGLYSFQFGDAFHYVKVFAMDANARALCENVQVPSAKE